MLQYGVPVGAQVAVGVAVAPVGVRVALDVGVSEGGVAEPVGVAVAVASGVNVRVASHTQHGMLRHGSPPASHSLKMICAQVGVTVGSGSVGVMLGVDVTVAVGIGVAVAVCATVGVRVVATSVHVGVAERAGGGMVFVDDGTTVGVRVGFAA